MSRHSVPGAGQAGLFEGQKAGEHRQRPDSRAAAASTADFSRPALSDLLGTWPGCVVADLCEDCGKPHGTAGCHSLATVPPAGLLDASGALTPLGAVVEAAADFLTARGSLDPDAVRYPDWEYPNWVLAELAEIAQEQPCNPVRRTAPDGDIHPSDAADHFETRRREEWRRWLPSWACKCGRSFKVTRDSPSISFYDTRPDGLPGDHRGGIELDSSRRAVKASAACPGCGALFADTIAGYPVTPRPRPPAEPPAALF